MHRIKFQEKGKQTLREAEQLSCEDQRIQRGNIMEMSAMPSISTHVERLPTHTPCCHLPQALGAKQAWSLNLWEKHGIFCENVRGPRYSLVRGGWKGRELVWKSQQSDMEGTWVDMEEDFEEQERQEKEGRIQKWNEKPQDLGSCGVLVLCPVSFIRSSWHCREILYSFEGAAWSNPWVGLWATGAITAEKRSGTTFLRKHHCTDAECILSSLLHLIRFCTGIAVGKLETWTVSVMNKLTWKGLGSG